MERVTDQLLLFVLCAFLLIGQESYALPVFVAVAMVGLSGLALYVEKPGKKLILFVIYLLALLMVPEFILFFPLVLYEVFRERFWWGLAAGLLLGLVWQSLTAMQLALWLFGCVLAFFLNKRTGEVLAGRHKLIVLRDSDKELENLMRAKNRELIEKQDYEIHVATLQERNRIAREIHDNVGHMLSRSILQMGALQTIYQEEPLQGQLVGINETLNQAMNNIRESIHDLHNDSIDLRQSILDATKDMQPKYQVHLEYDVTGAVPRKIKYCFIAIVKEAVANILKHSNGDQVTIIIREHPALYQLCVEDNGNSAAGKPVDSLQDGIGLYNMRERVEALQGSINIENKDGFRIFITIGKDTKA
ncbi:MAG: sensor histidine kinase [Roseburia sp.]